MILTERLAIRRVRYDDWQAMQAIWTEVWKSSYAKYDLPNKTDDESVSLIVSSWASCESSTKHMFFAVCLQDMVIGYIALNQVDDGYELGYCFHPSYQGKGYAKESLSNLLDDLMDQGFKRIIARTALQNIPSVRLLKALGFQQVGEEKVSFYQDEEGNDIFFDGGIFTFMPDNG